jgi:spore cortex biosynthesis protein YabQ
MTIGIGILAAFCYDYYREIRRAFRFKKTGAILGDLIFWLLITVIVFALLLEANWGELRMYVFLGLGMGALLYYYLLSRPVSRLVRIKFYIIHRIYRLFVQIISFLWNAVLTPFRFVILLITYPLRVLRLFFKKTGRRVETGLKNFTGGITKRSAGAVRQATARLAFWKKDKE